MGFKMRFLSRVFPDVLAAPARIPARQDRPSTAKVCWRWLGHAAGRWGVGVSLGCLVLLHGAALVSSAWVHSPTVDEVGHLAGAVDFWTTGHLELYHVNPPLPRVLALLPGSGMDESFRIHISGGRFSDRAEFPAGRWLFQQHPHRAWRLLFRARVVSVLWSVAGLVLCFVWAKELFGRWGGLLAATLWSFSPNVLGFGWQLVPDVPAATAGLLALYALWQWCRRGGWKWTLTCGVAVGVAVLTKFTWLFLGLFWVGCALVVGLASPLRRLREVLGQVVLGGCVAVGTVNTGYLWKDVFVPLGDFHFRTHLLGGESGNRLAQLPGLATVPVPLPKLMVLGVDRQMWDFERGLRSYLRGRWQERGWWYYYLYAAAIKVPLGTWALVLMSTVNFFRVGHPPGRGAWLFPALGTAAVMVLLSVHSGFSHHFRYALPGLGPLFVFAAGAVALPLVAPLWQRLLVVGWLGWAAVSSASVFPHSLSYFNELAGGPEGGAEHLLDSNIDWGQDLWYLQGWLRHHASAEEPVYVAYFGLISPRWYGIRFRLPPSVPTPGTYAVSVNCLYGIRFPIYAGDGTRVIETHAQWLRYLRPVARAGYSIWIYRVSQQQAYALRRRLGLYVPAENAPPSRQKPGRSSSNRETRHVAP